MIQTSHNNDKHLCPAAIKIGDAVNWVFAQGLFVLGVRSYTDIDPTDLNFVPGALISQGIDLMGHWSYRPYVYRALIHRGFHPIGRFIPGAWFDPRSIDSRGRPIHLRGIDSTDRLSARLENI